MPADFKVGDVIQFRMEFGDGSDVAFNIMHWRVKSVVVTATGLPPATSVPFADVAEDLAQDVFDMFATAWANFASANVIATACTAQSVYPGIRSIPYTYTPAASVPGVAPGDALPMQDTPTILKKSDVGQRWGLGRIFIAGIPESGQNGGILTDATALSINGLAGVLEIFAGGTADVYTYQVEPVLFGKIEGGHRVTVIKNFALSDKILKTQRRRRPGKGI